MWRVISFFRLMPGVMEIYHQIIDVLKFHQWNHNKRQVKVCMKLPESGYKFTCLAIDARVGFLYDYGALCVECAQEIAEALSTGVSCLHDLIVVEFGLDILFVRPGNLTVQLNEAVPCFIRVDNATPELLFEKPKDLDNLLQKLVDFMSQQSVARPIKLVLDTSEFTSGPSVFGILIGYPVCYYMETDSNCLSNTPLSVTQCTTNLAMKEFLTCSFSCPVTIMNDHSVVRDAIRKWALRFEAAFANVGIYCHVNSAVASFNALTL